MTEMKYTRTNPFTGERFEDVTAPSGYRCSGCDMWVPSGMTHQCRKRYIPEADRVRLIFGDSNLGRIADALERIADALEKADD